ncbi:hypothetical protein VCJ71_07310 [Alteriqipengyuania sp. WL0013]|uniref:hypothetical protein n=1 Tax=Alteriqipengyuania sp. WL0013 TaxID=3110773 RepID=UPI002D00A14F|nr:hypothetical protein [Alteriqipengyuania sp. WL0013]MEB3415871.1 hypothetical protein [Alteriqipengyuania sp. WL0013]
MRDLLLPIVAVLSFGLGGDAKGTDPSACLGNIREALVSSGFSGSVDCEMDDISLVYVGQVKAADHLFRICEHRYRLRPACPECAVHGGRRFLFLSNGRYLGQYRSDFVNAHIEDGILVFVPDDLASARTEVVFTRDGPPAEILVDGEVVRLFR